MVGGQIYLGSRSDTINGNYLSTPSSESWSLSTKTDSIIISAAGFGDGRFEITRCDLGLLECDSKSFKSTVNITHIDTVNE